MMAPVSSCTVELLCVCIDLGVVELRCGLSVPAGGRRELYLPTSAPRQREGDGALRWRAELRLRKNSV
jgi:hypothetical protein